MANYNPNNPDVVGNEWVAIVPAPYTMDSGTERGYRFTATTAQVTGVRSSAGTSNWRSSQTGSLSERLSVSQ